MQPLKPTRRYLTLLLLSAICFFSPITNAEKIPRELVVFAGTGMKAPLTEVGIGFKRQYGVRVLYHFEGSGMLGNKILVGQTPDIFIPGSETWAQILKKQGRIDNYIPFAYHTPVIITPKNNAKIKSLNDFAGSGNQIVLGDVKAAAVGRISETIIEKAGLDISRMNILARGMTVKQLVLWIEGNNADASIVWQADAMQSGKVTRIPIPGEYNLREIIPLCRLTHDQAISDQFVRYLTGAVGIEIFKRYGFEVIE